MQQLLRAMRIEQASKLILQRPDPVKLKLQNWSHDSDALLLAPRVPNLVCRAVTPSVCLLLRRLQVPPQGL